MKLTTRISASGFIEIKVDEIETTIFKHSKNEIEQMIDNLLNVIDELEKLSD
jgi:hypothetical protein